MVHFGGINEVASLRNGETDLEIQLLTVLSWSAQARIAGKLVGVGTLLEACKWPRFVSYFAMKIRSTMAVLSAESQSHSAPIPRVLELSAKRSACEYDMRLSH